MELVRWISRLFGWLKPVALPLRRIKRNGSRRRSVLRTISCLFVVIGFLLPLTAWSGTGGGDRETDVSKESTSMPAAQTKPRRMVAAGVGFQNDDTSTITVKTYDAESGAILSEDTYELSVKEDEGPAAGKVRERIFAGGVGTGANGLSEFSLRVYDAATGRFMWEGVLNLSPSPESSAAHQAVAGVSPQTIVAKIRRRTAVEGQPEFLIRAVDPATGQLVWTDQFSAGAGRLARPERIGRSVIGQTEFTSGPSRDIDFRIRMLDDRERHVIWEDRLAPAVEDADATSGQNDSAERLPSWQSVGGEASAKAAI